MINKADNYDKVYCATCKRKGKVFLNQICEACGGNGTVLVAKPAQICPICKGSGKEFLSQACRVCGGCGWAHRLK